VKSNAGIELEFTGALIEYIAVRGFDPSYGARPIKRLIQREIENTLAAEMLTKQLPEKVTVDFDGKNIVLK